MEPLFVLAPGRSYTSVISTMLGQHPQLYGVPELNLNAADSMAEWWRLHGLGFNWLAHGLLRAVAEIYFGCQNDRTILEARSWLRMRLGQSTAAVFRELATAVQPCGLVEKSPGMVDSPEEIARYATAFPEARYLHLLRHPRSTGRSMLSSEWGRACAAFVDSYDYSTSPPVLDAQIAWYRIHMTIGTFLDTVPADRVFRLRGEDLLEQPALHLAAIAEWLGVRTDQEAISAMMHPEESPFACFGPPSAAFGQDPSFLQDPELRPYVDQDNNLDDPLAWRGDGKGFLSEVRMLAEAFGYS